MELQVNKKDVSYLKPCLQETQNVEETLEIRLPDGMPDIGRILSAWGQPVLRGKEWRKDRLTVSAGLMVWVLYMPEEGGSPQQLEGWIPFQIKWDQPEDSEQGSVQVSLASRFTDARAVSARKILVRGGLGAYVETQCPAFAVIPSWKDEEDKLQCLFQKHPIRFIQEAGETTFSVQEDVAPPAGSPKIHKMIYANLTPRLQEERVTANRAVFRGACNLHYVYLDEDGMVSCLDYPLSFSQLGDLDRNYPEAGIHTVLSVTSLETEVQENGALNVKCGLTAQYLVDQTELVEVVSDAYYPEMETCLSQDEILLPGFLEDREEEIRGRQSLCKDTGKMADMLIQWEQPWVEIGREGKLRLFGSCQTLFYDEEGGLQASNVPLELDKALPSERGSRVSGRIKHMESVDRNSIQQGNGELSCRVLLRTASENKLPMITQIQIGEKKPAEGDRPSMILRRAGSSGLWELAKKADTTMDTIRAVNHLPGEPVPGQMLLIPLHP